MAVHEHKEKAQNNVRCFVITVSDSRDESTDTSGQTIKQFLIGEGHHAAGYRIVKDEPVQIEALLNEALASDRVRDLRLHQQQLRLRNHRCRVRQESIPATTSGR